MKILVIGANELRRLVRDRGNLFFVFLLPVLLILVIGVVFGSGFDPRIGVAAGDGELAGELVADLEANDDLDVTPAADEAEIVQLIERGDLEAGVVIPDDYDETIRSGGIATIRYLSSPSAGGFEVQAIVEAPIAEQAARVRSARFAAGETGVSLEEALQAASSASGFVGGVDVDIEGESEAAATSAVGQFDLGAAQNLVLFMFITALASSAALIQTRRLGVARRMLSTPTSAGTVIMGQAVGRYLVVLLQGVFIIAVAGLAFGVDWGSPIGAGALVLAFCLVGTGAGMLVGSLFSNEQQAGGIGVFVALGFGALGGSMVPLEVFPETMRRIAHATPHAWALDGFSDLIRDQAGVLDILPEIGVLVAYGAVLIVAASWVFGRVLTR